MPYEPKLGMSIEDLDTPALLLDLDAFEHNIATMSRFFAERPAALRPHAKTHKCPRIALRQIEAGAIGITCAKVGEAEVLARAGIRDILIANQVVGPIKIDRLTDLALDCDVMVAVDDPANVDALSEGCRSKGASLRVLVEVDIGMERCGVLPGVPALELAQHISESPYLQFTGLMGYEGHLVTVPDPQERATRVREAMALLERTVGLLHSHGLPVQIVSGGGTGTYDVTGALPFVTEVQAGSYVLMDSTYAQIRPEFEPSLTVLSTVISRPAPDRAIVDAGMKAMSKEFGIPQPLGLPGAATLSLSEEHARLSLGEPNQARVRPGDRVRFLPSHCCTTVNLYDTLHVVQRGRLVDFWPIAARGRGQ